jgi:hypothetical protein
MNLTTHSNSKTRRTKKKDSFRRRFLFLSPVRTAFALPAFLAPVEETLGGMMICQNGSEPTASFAFI